MSLPTCVIHQHHQKKKDLGCEVPGPAISKACLVLSQGTNTARSALWNSLTGTARAGPFHCSSNGQMPINSELFSTYMGKKG